MSGRGRGGIRAVRPYHVALFFRCRDEDVSNSSIYVSYAVHRVAVISHVILVWSILGLLARSLGAFTLVGVWCGVRMHGVCVCAYTCRIKGVYRPIVEQCKSFEVVDEMKTCSQGSVDRAAG